MELKYGEQTWKGCHCANGPQKEVWRCQIGTVAGVENTLGPGRKVGRTEAHASGWVSEMLTVAPNDQS